MKSAIQNSEKIFPDKVGMLHQTVAVAVAAALLITVPGLPFYQACAAPFQSVPVTAGGAGIQGAVPVVGANIRGAALPVAVSGVAGNTALDFKGLRTNLPDAVPGAVSPVPANAASQAGFGVLGSKAGIPGAASLGSLRSLPASLPSRPAVLRSQESLSEAGKQVESVLPDSSKVREMPAQEAWAAGQKSFEPILRERWHGGDALPIAGAQAGNARTVPVQFSRPGAGPARTLATAGGGVPTPKPDAPKPAGKTAAIFRTLLSVAGGAALVIGAQALTATLLPGAFGLVSTTAAWMVLNTVLVAAVFNPIRARIRLAKSETQGLTGTKVYTDLALGGVLGALAVSATALGSGAFSDLPSLLLKGIVDVLQGVSSTGVLSPAPLLGIAALAAVSAISYMLPFITGKRPVTKQAMGFFPRFLWVGLGVPFALASGFAAPAKILNYVFVAWNLSGSIPLVGKAFNAAFVLGWAYAAFMGFATPITFLLIAFTPERAVVFTAWIIQKLLGKDEPGKAAPGDDYNFSQWITHPNTGERIKRLESPILKPGARDPFHYRLKTVLLMGGLFSGAVAIVTLVTGFSSFWIPLLIGAGITGLQWFFSHKLAVKMFGGVPYKDKVGEIPRLERIHDMLVRMSAKLNTKVPEFYFIPSDKFPGPNAFATGRDPKHAVVAVTEDILKIMDDRELEGVLAHEMQHVMHRDILLGSITGSVGIAINWATYNIMWMMTKGRILISRLTGSPVTLEDKASDRTGPEHAAPGSSAGGQSAQVVPVAGLGVFTPILLKVFASIWAPVLVTLLQMGHTRNREFYADEDGALLLGDGKPLADGLRKLMGWKPGALSEDQKMRLPMIFALGHLMTVSPVEQFLGVSTAETSRPEKTGMSTPNASLPPIGTKARGAVKWFNESKGYGFITLTNGTDVFVHRDDIQGGWDKPLKENEEVEFEIAETPLGTVHAAKVVRLGGSGPAANGIGRSSNPHAGGNAAPKILKDIGTILFRAYSALWAGIRFMVEIVSKVTHTDQGWAALISGGVALAGTVAVVVLHGPGILVGLLMGSAALFLAYALNLESVKAFNDLKVAVEEKRDEIMSIPGVVSIDILPDPDSRTVDDHFVLIKVVYLDAENLSRIPKTIQGHRVVTRIVPAVPAGNGVSMGIGRLSFRFDTPPPPDAQTASAAGLGTQAPRGSFISRAWQKITSPFRVTKDRSRNRSLWTFLIGQMAIVLGFEFQSVALPGLVGGDSAQLGKVNAARQGAHALSSLTTGYVVDKVPSKSLLVWTGYARAFILGLVPFIFFTGNLSLAPIIILMTVAGFVQSTSMNAGRVAFMKILGDDESTYTRAYSLAMLTANIVSILGPLLAGTFMGAMDLTFGPGAGAVLTLGVYGALTLFSAVLYHVFLKVPNDAAAVQSQTSGAKEGSNFKSQFREFTEGFRLIWASRFLRRTMMVSSFEYLVGRPLFYLAIPLYAKEIAVQGAAAAQSLFGNIPVIGLWLKAMTSTAGSYGILLAASSLGMTLAAAAVLGAPGLVAWAQKQDGKGWKSLLAAPLRAFVRLTGKIRGTPLERQGALSYWMAAVSHISFLGLLFTNNILAAAGILLLHCFFDGPESIVWDSLVNKVLDSGSGDLAKNKGKVVSAVEFFYTVLSIIGMLAMGYLLGGFSAGSVQLWSTMGAHTAMLFAAAASMVCALLHIVEPFIVFPMGKKAKEARGGK